jgi:hypothetical protein
MAFVKNEKRYTVKQLVKMNEKGQIRGDLAIQRNEVWDLKRKSLLIHSLMVGFPVPVIFAEDTGDKYLWLLDGKQRTSAIFGYVGGAYPLHRDTPDVVKEDGTVISVRNKFFSELDEELQDAIYDYNLLIWSFRGMTEEDKEEMFIRLNGGMPLKSVELLRVHAGSNLMDVVTKLKHMSFFEKSVNISKSVKNRFGDEESIFQIMYLMDSNTPYVGFGSDELRQFIQDIRWRGGLENEFVQMLETVTEYLGEAFPVREGFIKKVNIPMLFYTASKAIEMNIPAKKFGGWAQQFFEENAKDTPYAEACKSGTGKPDKVATRVKLMMEHFEANIHNAKDYYSEKYEKELAKEKARIEAEEATKEVAADTEVLTVDGEAVVDVQTHEQQNQEQDQGQSVEV